MIFYDRAGYKSAPYILITVPYSIQPNTFSMREECPRKRTRLQIYSKCFRILVLHLTNDSNTMIYLIGKLLVYMCLDRSMIKEQMNTAMEKIFGGNALFAVDLTYWLEVCSHVPHNVCLL